MRMRLCRGFVGACVMLLVVVPTLSAQTGEAPEPTLEDVFIRSIREAEEDIET